MERIEKIKFEPFGFGKRLRSMLCVDFRRMFTMRLFYIMAGISFVIPILVLVMTTMMDGTTTVNPQTGVETTMEAFENTWQAIGTVSGESSAMAMDLTSMCNINLIYFAIAVFIGLFVSADFRSGYAKNLFTVRSKKSDYVISKTFVGFIGGICMLLAYFIGAMLGGTIAGLPFDTGSAGVDGIVMCMITKILLMAVFAPIYLLMSVVAKEKAWLSIVGSLCVGMLFFMIIPIMTPLDAGMMNVLLCLVGGVLFSIGFGAVSSRILGKTSLM